MLTIIDNYNAISMLVNSTRFYFGRKNKQKPQ